MLLAVGSQLALGLAHTIPEAVHRLDVARRRRHESGEQARRRALGDLYVDGVERAAAAIPPEQPYLLVDVDGTGRMFVLQGDLAPRCARRFEGRMFARRRARGAPPPLAAPPQAVVFRGFGEPLEVAPTEALFPGRRRH